MARFVIYCILKKVKVLVSSVMSDSLHDFATQWTIAH